MIGRALSQKSCAYLQLFGLFLAGSALYFLFEVFDPGSERAHFDPPALAKEKIQFTEAFFPAESSPGFNLLYPVRPKVFLVNLQGEVEHFWDLRKIPPLREQEADLFHVEELPDASILAIFNDYGLARVSWDGKMQWFFQARFHHDSAMRSDGNILALARKPSAFSHRGVQGKALADVVLLISPDGKLLQEFNLLDLFLPKLPLQALQRSKYYTETHQGDPKAFKNDSPADVLHTNSLEILHRDIPGVARAGDILVSLRTRNAIAIVNASFTKVLWYYDEELDHQHDATQARDGMILLFDNGERRKWSRILKIDPRSNHIDWEYGRAREQRFFTFKRGGVQELPNGNYLITVAFPGTLLEVSPDKRIIWKAEKMKKKIGKSIYRARRIHPESPFVSALGLK